MSRIMLASWGAIQRGNAMAKKGTPAGEYEIIRVYYGINPQNYEIERVSQTRGGTLTKWHKEISHTHPVPRGCDPRNEVATLYGLRHIYETTLSLDAISDDTQYIALKAKAVQMKADAEAKAQSQDQGKKDEPSAS